MAMVVLGSIKTLTALVVATAVASVLLACGGGGVGTSDASADETAAPAATPSWEPIWVSVEYRSTRVDVGAPYFKRLERSGSSLVTAAWYDDDNDYLVINLDGTNYHYCRFPRSAWAELREAESMGRHYNAEIRGEYDCRASLVPSYD